ncbi:hypothetical protein LIER_41062 [Lithospermum erythrorhizon]|uniref:Uncharacterized protein n=1 Tax=Lithospermum erythrorhizon TaxID=34254 RepID=A0AAV3R5U9_LITER
MPDKDICDQNDVLNENSNPKDFCESYVKLLIAVDNSIIPDAMENSVGMKCKVVKSDGIYFSLINLNMLDVVQMNEKIVAISNSRLLSGEDQNLFTEFPPPTHIPYSKTISMRTHTLCKFQHSQRIKVSLPHAFPNLQLGHVLLHAKKFHTGICIQSNKDFVSLFDDYLHSHYNLK